MSEVERIAEFISKNNHLLSTCLEELNINRNILPEYIFGTPPRGMQPLFNASDDTIEFVDLETKSGVYRFDFTFDETSLRPLYILVDGKGDSFILHAGWRGMTTYDRFRYPEGLDPLFSPLMKTRNAIIDKLWPYEGVENSNKLHARYARIGDVRMEKLDTFLQRIRSKLTKESSIKIIDDMIESIHFKSYAIFHYRHGHPPELYDCCNRLDTARRIFEAPEEDSDVIGGKLIEFVRGTPESEIEANGHVIEIFGVPDDHQIHQKVGGIWLA